MHFIFDFICLYLGFLFDLSFNLWIELPLNLPLLSYLSFASAAAPRSLLSGLLLPVPGHGLVVLDLPLSLLHVPLLYLMIGLALVLVVLLVQALLHGLLARPVVAFARGAPSL